MLLLDLFEARQITNEKLWVNPSAKKIITVPNRDHHTQMVYLKPEKFGLPKDLFTNHEYPMLPDWMDMPSEHTPFDPDVGKAMFDRGWVRVNVSENIIRSKPLIVEGLHADLHGTNLKVIAKALGYLNRNNYDIRSIIVAKGEDIEYNVEHIISEPERVKLFMRNGVIPRKRITEMDMMDISWASWWINPQMGDLISLENDGENSHWVYVEKYYMNMVAEVRAAKYILTNYNIWEDNDGFDKISKMIFDSGWVRAGYPYQKDMYLEGADDKTIWRAARKLVEELEYPEIEKVDIHNVTTDKAERLIGEDFDKYLKTGRIPRQRIVEGVGENLLYHGTLLYKATRILEVKALTRGRISRRYMKISPRDLKASKRNELAFSMSRDPNLNFADLGKGNAEIVFVFRRDVLANNFTIIPYDFAGTAQPHYIGVEPKEESEEQVLGKRIPVNSKTVAKIIIRPSAYGDDGNGAGTGGDLNLLRELAKENNIPIMEER